MEDRVIYRFLWWPLSIGFGKPRKWLVFKGIVQKYRAGEITATGGYNLFGDKAYNWTSSYWSNQRWYVGAVNEPKLAAMAVIKGLLYSFSTLFFWLIGIFVFGRIAWVVAPEFWKAISYIGIGIFNFLFGWML
jgi:hypothetical protein